MVVMLCYVMLQQFAFNRQECFWVVSRLKNFCNLIFSTNQILMMMKCALNIKSDWLKSKCQSSALRACICCSKLIVDSAHLFDNGNFRNASRGTTWKYVCVLRLSENGCRSVTFVVSFSATNLADKIKMYWKHLCSWAILMLAILQLL